MKVHDSIYGIAYLFYVRFRKDVREVVRISQWQRNSEDDSMKKEKLIIMLLLVLALVLSACSSGTAKSAEGQQAAEENAKSEEKILHAAASFAYPSLDVHKEYYGWYTSIYGLSEALFRLDETSSAVPCLAKDAVLEDKTWTITLDEKAAFSNGTKLTAEMARRNLERAAEVNERFAFLGEFTIKAADDATLKITTPEIYPTLKNDLASPELGMIDLDATEDFDHNPVCTGPFVMKEFIPEGDVTVAKNDRYWNGTPQIDGAVFYYMQEDDPKLLAMQSGEIDCYDSVSSAALEVYRSEPDKYNVVQVPGARLQFYILNENRMDDAVRQAVNLTVDKESIASYMSGTVSPAVGPFSTETAYGQVTVPAADPDKAKRLLEQDGYEMGSDGFYRKNDEKLTLNIAYYAARSLDTIAVLMKEELAAVGIDSVLTVEEDPDSTYIATADFDIALYCMIADKSGDPLYFIDSTLADGAYFNVGGFEDASCQEKIEQLRYETDSAKRAQLANEIIQIAIDDNAFGYVGLFNKTTVLKPGVSGYAEQLPFDFYGISTETVMP